MTGTTASDDCNHKWAPRNGGLFCLRCTLRKYDSETMWCAGCGKKLKGQCCKDKGYWSQLPPLPADAWALDRKVYRPEIKAFLYLYRFPK